MRTTLQQRLYQKAYIRRKYVKKKREIQRENYLNFIANCKSQFGCAECGEDDPRALVFHHVNPKEKKFAINNITWDRKNVLAEIAKCEILCQACHVIYHTENGFRIIYPQLEETTEDDISESAQMNLFENFG